MFIIWIVLQLLGENSSIDILKHKFTKRSEIWCKIFEIEDLSIKCAQTAESNVLQRCSIIRGCYSAFWNKWMKQIRTLVRSSNHLFLFIYNKEPVFQTVKLICRSIWKFILRSVCKRTKQLIFCTEKCSGSNVYFLEDIINFNNWLIYVLYIKINKYMSLLQLNLIDLVFLHIDSMTEHRNKFRLWNSVSSFSRMKNVCFIENIMLSNNFKFQNINAHFITHDNYLEEFKVTCKILPKQKCVMLPIE